MSNDFNWISFYTELATKLLAYRSNREDIIKKIEKAFSNVGMSLPKLESNGKPKDIDPFTVFGLFNRGLTDENRTKIANGLATEFGVTAEVPLAFTGIPVLTNMNMAFYRFMDDERRTDADLDNLWDTFEAAIRLSEEDTTVNRDFFTASYNKVIAQVGIRWNITMGLYWIRPNCFLSLDDRNHWFLSKPEYISDVIAKVVGNMKTVPPAKDYLDICDSVLKDLKTGKYEYRSFPELSYKAWVTTNENKEKFGSFEGSEKPISDVPSSNAIGDKEIRGTHYWMYAAGFGSNRWDEYYKSGVMAIGWGEIGDLSEYSGKDEMKEAMKDVFGRTSSYKNAALAVWQFAYEMKPGDIIFVKRGKQEIVGRGIVTSDYRYDSDCKDDFGNIRDVDWTHKGSWILDNRQIVQKTLTDITQYTEYVKTLNELFELEGDETEPSEISYDPYTEENFLHDVFMEAERYHKLVNTLKRKKNLILQGAPGVGKTYVAKRLAYSIMGKKDTSRVTMIQFHQSYSYEDFIMGFRPSKDGFVIHEGAFYNICMKAREDDKHDYFFIIDEINRGNISKIFGELFMLIEGDKRGISLGLLYRDEQFWIPENVYIIGMMNTADRSLAMLDYALRRRFAFFDFAPAFGLDSFEAYRKSKGNSKYDKLIETVMELNDIIKKDDSLGEGFRIGHSYFVTDEDITDDFLDEIVEYELIPLLKEYWFDEPSKVKTWSENLRGAVK